jgi:hypothetical protein
MKSLTVLRVRDSQNKNFEVHETSDEYGLVDNSQHDKHLHICTRCYKWVISLVLLSDSKRLQVIDTLYSEKYLAFSSEHLTLLGLFLILLPTSI